MASNTMKAAVYKGINQMAVEERPIPPCPDDGLLIKVHYCGICGSDVRNFSGGLRNGTTDQIMGHEIGGEIVEVGRLTERFSVGQHVSLAPDISCGTCYYCKRGLVNLCLNHRMLGTDIPGGFAQYLALPKEVLEHGFVEPIPDDMPFKDAAFAEAASGVVACQKRLGISAGDTVVVIGDGPIGCIHTELAHARGAKVILAGLTRLSFLEPFHPDLVLDNSDPEHVIKEVMKFTNNIGAQYVILAVPTVFPQQEALEMVCKRGTIVIYGGAPKDKCIGQMNSNMIHYNEINVIGSFSYSATGLADSLDVIYNNQIHVDKYINAIVSLEDIPKGIEMARRGEALKVLVDPWKE